MAHPTIAERFWEKVLVIDDEDSCWEWQADLNAGGYGRFYAMGGARLAHRLIWELENGPVPDGLFVLHKCDNRCCVRLSHLFLGTRADNMDDMVAKRRQTWGERNRHAKLTYDIVQAIKRRRAAGERVNDLARELGVDRHTITRALHDQTTWE